MTGYKMQALRMAGSWGGIPRNWGKDYVLKNEYGQDRLGRRRRFTAPGRCRHALAVYELAHNLMWLDMA